VVAHREHRWVSLALAGLCGTALLGAPSPSAATNLLANANFDTDVDGWVPQQVFFSIAFDDLDVDEDPESGSGKVSFNNTPTS
jgi:hypothetical protein